MAYVKKVNFDYRNMIVLKIADIEDMESYLELFKDLVTNNVDYTVNSNGVFVWNENTFSKHGV